MSDDTCFLDDFDIGVILDAVLTGFSFGVVSRLVLFMAVSSSAASFFLRKGFLGSSSSSSSSR